MDILNTPEEIKRVLDAYDKQEQEMNRDLASLEKYGPQSAYQTYERACARSRIQMNRRRRLIASMLH